MGVATIALLPLAHDHVINGCYQLLTVSVCVCVCVCTEEVGYTSSSIS